ncbi:MAG: IclR family transcriptional regulator [Marinovum algicola]|mgnify:FL=1|jgi:DNA-binding IclR family transcriptional regulator|uniref:Transcriptional regulator, IclR family n=1 Tax=Marinovum algicola TaxID=42444 RepID=A0A975W6N2_9RHOB|nr:IclR family transcriptional regulator [Marinovum algicola]SEI59127.1 transcriptional regulator, IclR family [Marinovum algicola]SLN27228.1 Transcriptional regulator KdgR [Marinovum algicola]
MNKPAANDATKKAKSSVPAVEKALDVLELLTDRSGGLTMNEIVDALGRTMGEIYRVVVYLTERGYLHQDPRTSRYALTLKLFELSHRHDPTERLIHAALPLLERIAARTSQSCHLGVLNRDNVLVLTSVQSPLPAGYAVRTGALFPVSQTSSGHVILAFSPEDVQDRHIARQPEDQRAALARRLARIRHNGFEDTPSTMITGVRNLCVPVFDTRGVTAAITSGFIGQVGDAPSAEDALATIRLTALELSRSLGFLPDASPFGAALTS